MIFVVVGSQMELLVFGLRLELLVVGSWMALLVPMPELLGHSPDCQLGR